MKEYLTNKQIAFLLFGIIVGYSVIVLPKNIVEAAGEGRWFSLLCSSIIAVILTYVITYLGYVHENKTIAEYSKVLTGNFTSFIIVSIYIIYFFLGFTCITRIVSEIIKLTLLIKTPVWILSLVLLLVSYYAVINRLQVIARICEIYGIFIILAFFITIIALFTEGKIINIQPFFVHENIRIYLKAIPVTIGPLMGMELISLVPFNKEINNKKVFKYTVFMVGFIGVLYILEVEVCLAIMGDDIIHYKDAFLAAIRRTDIKALEFLRRLDGIFIMFWIMAVFCSIIVWLYGTSFLIHKYLKKTNFNWIVLFVVILSFIVTRIPKTLDQAENLFKFTGYMGFVAAGPIPILLYIITFIKKNKI